MHMKTEITGKKILKEMRDIAAEYFQVYPNAGCVCVGVKRLDSNASSGRLVNGGRLRCYVGVSGDAGRTLLRDSLVRENGDQVNAQMVKTLLTTMTNNLVKYNSKKQGSAVVQKENWVTHNCAESNLALFLYRLGVNHRQVTIASYEKLGNSITYKAICKNCAQWVRQYLNVLSAFDASVRTT